MRFDPEDVRPAAPQGELLAKARTLFAKGNPKGGAP
jgi:hypothetical protein